MEKPRYDDVYHDGVKRLDSLAHEDLDNKETCKWKYAEGIGESLNGQELIQYDTTLYATECGKGFTIINEDCSLRDIEFHYEYIYCPYCSKPIEEIKE